MTMRPHALLAPGLLLLGLAACSGGEETTVPAGEEAGPDLSGLAIETAEARATQGVPLGTVPGQVSLPPEARVAVTPPFPGAAIRVYVIEGQAVSRGAPLALVRAAEPVSISADLARARSQVGLAEARSTRMEQLASEGIIAQARADEAAAELQQARATLAEAQRMAAISGTGPDGSMTLRSPISGRVAHVGVETGGPVDGMEAPFVIEAGGPFRIDLQLPERLARQVRPGMAVEVQLPTGVDGQTMPVGGQILSVAPSIDPQTRSVMAKASIGAAPGLVSGQNVMVTISGSGDGTGVSVPSTAVTRIGGEDHVFVRHGESFMPRAVQVVANAGGEAVIAEGLVAGEVVATSAITELKAASAE
ncbi:efflux RND transporter periplasmic adaptor subunit [Alteraurantiacibacter aquimixticola]|uniref:Efflux RND transporter periplasmic adaptor subunit n=1 Tax=Alteraurantiacibacter aquimixticola TaxID=2489173 RepID=A0A4T3EXI4_9SPHN|nr:efflux RND transporter periplasmic adaptor subunit [Alteraurantiacibacter aquimixticola]TIX49233.1 efflux RND transporter periplasmic adaptor subunit [Alteraurantiacibacter aquimixticola]